MRPRPIAVVNALGYACTEHVPTTGATHIVLTKGA
jgi:hypothetical protein